MLFFQVASFVRGLPGCREHAATFRKEVNVKNRSTFPMHTNIKKFCVCKIFQMFLKGVFFFAIRLYLFDQKYSKTVIL